jgi:hypothetical protein
MGCIWMVHGTYRIGSNGSGGEKCSILDQGIGDGETGGHAGRHMGLIDRTA